MMFLEMSRTPEHGGGSWQFPNCLWSPTRKKSSARTREGQTSAYWENLLKVRTGDTVFHLRGASQDLAWFVGHSVAAGAGYITTERPPQPGKWNYADRFYRVDLTDYTTFDPAIKLTDIFRDRRQDLEAYYDENRTAAERRSLFYTRQKGVLQCQFGAYLSEIDERLFEIMFGRQLEGYVAPDRAIRTGEGTRLGKFRVGQQAFSERTKDAYGQKCCFPDCSIGDDRFLIGAHIARWSDNTELRGHPGNGLCLCTFHDRAFEHGLFTLDRYFRIYVNDAEKGRPHSPVMLLLPFHGRRINTAATAPLLTALEEHWMRVGLFPDGRVVTSTTETSAAPEAPLDDISDPE